MLDAESDHRVHAVIENVHADLRNGPLAHLPSGRFAAARLARTGRRPNQPAAAE